MRSRLLTSLFLLFSFSLFSQYNIDDFNGQTIYLDFYGGYLDLFDSGGQFGNYGNNENYSVTVCSQQPIAGCPDIPGISCIFDYFSVEGDGTPNCGFDRLGVQYDFYQDYYCDDNLPPLYGGGFNISGISDNDGCITISFESDGSVTQEGFWLVLQTKYPNNTYPVDLHCDDGFSNEYIDVIPNGCYTCIDQYECPQGVFHNGYYGLEERYYLSDNVTEQVVIDFSGDVDCFISGYSQNLSQCYEVPIACATGGEQSVSFDPNGYTNISIIFDSQFNSSFDFYINCLDPCEEAYPLYCDEYFADSNDPHSNLKPETKTSDFLYDHHNCTYDGCRHKTFDGAEFYNPEVIYRLDQGYGHLTVDLKPASVNLDVDLFIYDGCTYSPGNNNNKQTVMECEFSSTEQPNRNDAVFIEDVANTGNLYAVVDAQSNGSGGVNNIGDYIIGFTCGYLRDHAVTELNCGEWYEANNVQGFNYASYYCCDPSDHKGGNFGPEQVYSFYLDQAETVTISLDIQENKDLNLYLLSDLEVDACMDLSKTYGNADESITINLSPGTYYIAVEGYCGDYGDYRIKVDGCGEVCSDCSWCFDFVRQVGIEGGPDYYEFVNNYCESNTNNKSLATYDWSFPSGSVAEYLEGTSSSSYEPKCRLNPGRWEVCLRITYAGRSYNCCLIIIVPPIHCPIPPPVCGLNYSETSPGLFNFDASTSQGAESYHWTVEDAETRDTFALSSTDFYEQTIDIRSYPNRCFIVTCYVSNCYGVSKVSIKVCYEVSSCNTSNPGGPYYITPVTENGELTFEGVPTGFDSYEWSVPDELNFISGDANSPSWRCGIPSGRTYRICLILRKGCYVYCYCWNVRRGCCPNTPCESRSLSCNEYITDDNIEINSTYKTDQLTSYHQYGCFEFKTNNGQNYTPLFRSIESRYAFSQPDLQLRPTTIDVYNIDKGSYDPDIFLFRSCQGGVPRECIDYSGHLPPPYNESVFIPANEFQTSDDLYMVVDGQSFSSGAVNQGNYIIGVTCGPIDGGVHTSVPIETLRCEETFTGNTSNNRYGNHASFYSCDPESNRGNNWGKEVIHQIEIDETGGYEVELTFASSIDLNLYLLDEISSQSCIDLSKNMSGNRESITRNLTPGIYYVVVEGFAGDEGAYSLTVTGCTPQEVCTFDIGEGCANLGLGIDVPVFIDNFEEVHSFGFEILHNSNNIRIVDIAWEHPMLEGLIINSNVVSDNRAIIGWVSESGNPITVANGEIAFYIEVEVLNNFSTPIRLYSDNTEIETEGNSGIRVLDGEVCYSESISISGQVRTPSGNPKPNQTVELTGPSSTTTQTVNNGNYTFSNIPAGNYQITCYDNDNLKEGVSISDVGKLRRHYLEKQFITEDYDLLAGDVNKNGSISISDVGLARRIYLEKISTLTNNTSWRFMPAAMDISANPMDPNRDGTLYVNANTTITGADIIAVKVGDVNNSVNRLVKEDVENRFRIDLNLTIGDLEIRPNTQGLVPVLATMNSDLSLFGATLLFDPSKITVNGIVPGSIIDLNSANYNVLDGRVLIGWEESLGEGMTPSNDTLFYLDITSGSTMGTTQISIDDSEILDGNFEEYSVVHQSGSIRVDQNVSIVELEQEDIRVFPNPFHDEVSIYLPEEWSNKESQVRIYDINGVLLHSQKSKDNKITIDKDLDQGVHLLEVIHGDKVIVKPIVRM